MQMEIKLSGLSLTGSLHKQATRRLCFALAHDSGPVRRLAVRLAGINAPRGGNDKRCQIQVVLNGLGDATIEDNEADLYIAIDRAAALVGRKVARRVAHQRECSIG